MSDIQSSKEAYKLLNHVDVRNNCFFARFWLKDLILLLKDMESLKAYLARA
jgi:hypothetical protein